MEEPELVTPDPPYPNLLFTQPTQQEIADMKEEHRKEQKRMKRGGTAIQILQMLIMGEIKKESWNELPPNDLVDRAFDMAEYFEQKLESIE